MNYLLLFPFVFCVVKCGVLSNNYFVVEMPDENYEKDMLRKLFHVYWNVPTIQCRSKKIPFENLDQFGIIQNKNDSFKGEKVVILYDPGLFPALIKNETSGKIKFRNGGVPQEGDIEKHLDAFRFDVNKSIPDPDFNGVAIIDFESWRPVFRQNFGVLVPYKDVSYEIERKRHWWWTSDWIKEEAKIRFEEYARTFMQTTISIGKQMRPLAQWGYYGFPYCFNGAGKYIEDCARGVTDENDRIYWLWIESSALFPSIYSSNTLQTWQLASFVRGRMKEASRVAAGRAPVLPYFWFRYREGGYLTEKDLIAVLQTLNKSNASGFVIWGSSNDVNTMEKCSNLHDYVYNTLGPLISKFTSHVIKGDDNILFEDIMNDGSNSTESAINVTLFADENLNTNISSSITNNPNEMTTSKVDFTIKLEPEMYWNPPVNYTIDLIKNVEDEFIKKYGSNITLNQKEEEAIVQNVYDNILIDIILQNITVDNNQTSTSNLSTISDIIENVTKCYENVDSTINRNFSTSVSEYITTSTESTVPYEYSETITQNSITETSILKQSIEFNHSVLEFIFENQTEPENVYSTEDILKESSDTAAKTEIPSNPLEPVSIKTLLTTNIKKGFVNLKSELKSATTEQLDTEDSTHMRNTETTETSTTIKDFDQSTSFISYEEMIFTQADIFNYDEHTQSNEIFTESSTDVSTSSYIDSKTVNVGSLKDITTVDFLMETGATYNGNKGQSTTEVTVTAFDDYIESVSTIEQTVNNFEVSKNKKKGLLEAKHKIDKLLASVKVDGNSDSMSMKLISASHQVSGSASNISDSGKGKWYCYILHFYFLSRCLCEMYNQCT